MNEDDRLSKLKLLLGISSPERDEILKFTLESVENMILTYINCDTLPEQLERVLLAMCTSYYRSSGFGTETASVGAVTSVKRGDVETSFSTADSFDMSADSDGFFGWRTVLNGYRRLRR